MIKASITRGNVTIVGGIHHDPEFHMMIQNVIHNTDFDVVGLEDKQYLLESDVLFDVGPETITATVHDDSYSDTISAVRGSSDAGIGLGLIDTALDPDKINKEPGIDEDTFLCKMGVGAPEEISWDDLQKIREVGKAVDNVWVDERDERMKRHIRWMSGNFGRVLVVCGLAHLPELARYESSDPLSVKIWETDYEYEGIMRTPEEVIPEET